MYLNVILTLRVKTRVEPLLLAQTSTSGLKEKKCYKRPVGQSTHLTRISCQIVSINSQGPKENILILLVCILSPTHLSLCHTSILIEADGGFIHWCCIWLSWLNSPYCAAPFPVPPYLRRATLPKCKHPSSPLHLIFSPLALVLLCRCGEMLIHLKVKSESLKSLTWAVHIALGRAVCGPAWRMCEEREIWCLCIWGLKDQMHFTAALLLVPALSGVLISDAKMSVPANVKNKQTNSEI